MIPHTVQQNGITEHKNHILLDMFRSMMEHANLQICFSGDALLTTLYILNCVPNKSIFATSYELWFDQRSSLDYLYPWGSADCVHNPTHKHGKLSPKATKIVFIIFLIHSKGYVMYREHFNGGMTEIDFCKRLS